MIKQIQTCHVSSLHFSQVLKPYKKTPVWWGVTGVKKTHPLAEKQWKNIEPRPAKGVVFSLPPDPMKKLPWPSQRFVVFHEGFSFQPDGFEQCKWYEKNPRPLSPSTPKETSATLGSFSACTKRIETDLWVHWIQLFLCMTNMSCHRW